MIGQSEQPVDVRGAPDATFIADVRRRFRVEREIDRVLTRKLEHRTDPGFEPIALETIVQGVERLLRAEIGTSFAIRDPRWMTGGASKLQVAFELDWQPPGAAARTTTGLVLRMEPAESIVATSRLREFNAQKALAGRVPVPRCYWIDDDARYLPYPALVYEHVDGVTRPTGSSSKQGMAIDFGPLREKLANQFVDLLAATHTSPVDRLTADGVFDPAPIGSTEANLLLVDWWRRVWEEDRLIDNPLVEIAYQWLVANAPPIDHASLVHGDYRAGNFLFDEKRGEITAILDWELATLGDRHRDLAWVTALQFGAFQPDGTFFAAGLLPTDAFLERYEKASGLAVDPKRLAYFRVFNDFMGTITMSATAPRIAMAGKTHQDIVVTWIAPHSNLILDVLRQTLEETL